MSTMFASFEEMQLSYQAERTLNRWYRENAKRKQRIIKGRRRVYVA